MIVQDHVERMQFAVTDLGKTNIFIGHDWLKYHNPSIDWQKNTLLLDRCPHSCSFITNFSDLDADETWSTNTQQHDETHPLEEGERLFAFDIDGYLKSKCFTIVRVDDDHKINRTNYDYIMKYLRRKTSTNFQSHVPGTMPLNSLLTSNHSTAKPTTCHHKNNRN